ncbi:MAG: DUF4347 domain-containing protein [Bacteroidota bacterium]
MEKPLRLNRFNRNKIALMVAVFFLFLFSVQSKDVAFMNQGIGEPEQRGDTNDASMELVIIGDSFKNKISIKASLPIDVVVLEVSYTDELLIGLRDALRDNPNIINVHLFSETSNEGIELGNDIFNIDALDTYSNLLGAISDSQKGSSNPLNLFVYSCSLSANTNGLSFLSRLGDETNSNVLSATNCDAIDDENFVFDYSSTNSVIPMTALFH